MSTKICPKCSTTHSKSGIFCSRTCANSRGPRTDEFKETVRNKARGKTVSDASTVKRILTRGQTVRYLCHNTLCTVCNTDTGTKHRKTCSQSCRNKYLKILSQANPKCGGQKHTHRSKIQNINGEIFIAESLFEVKLAESLNCNNILWDRPAFFLYVDSSGNQRRYYPDFYLPNANVYLDPKNSYLIKTDIDKIINTAKQNNIRIMILGEKYLNYALFKQYISDPFETMLLE